MKCIGKLCEYYNDKDLKFICGLNGITYTKIRNVDCSIKQKTNEVKVKYDELVSLQNIIAELQED